MYVVKKLTKNEKKNKKEGYHSSFVQKNKLINEKYCYLASENFKILLKKFFPSNLFL